MRKQYAVFHHDDNLQYLVQSKRKATSEERNKAIMDDEDNPDERLAIFDTKEEAETYVENSLASHYPQFILEAYRP